MSGTARASKLIAVLATLMWLSPQLVACGGGGEAEPAITEPAITEPAITLPDGRKLVVVAGNGTSGFAGDGGPATEAELSMPYDLAWDTDGNLYIGQDYRISKVDAESGVITTFAGTGESGYSGDNGPATKAKVGRVQQIAFDAKGNLYFADFWYHAIRRVDTDGVITTVAGTGSPGFSPDGTPAQKASLNKPFGVAFGPDGRLYFSDGDNHRVRTIEPDGTIATVAGTGEPGETGDGGPATKARLDSPRGLAFDPAGNLYIGTHGGSRVRKMSAGGLISTLVETPATTVAPGDGGEVNLADWQSATISKWTADRGLEPVLEQGEYGPGGGDEATFLMPSQVALDRDGNIYISDDRATSRVYRLEP